MTTPEKLKKMNDLANNLRPWKGEMPIDLSNLRNEIWISGYDLFSEIEDFDKPFITRTIYGLKQINRNAVFDALTDLFEIIEEDDGTTHFFYEPLKGGSFVTVLYNRALDIFSKEYRKQTKTLSLSTLIGGNDILEITIEDHKGKPEEPIIKKDFFENFAGILTEIEKSFACFEGKAKKYIAYRALFTYDILKSLRRENDIDHFSENIKMIEKNKDFFMKNMDIDHFSFSEYRKIWRKNEENKHKTEESGTNIPALENGFIEYNIQSPIETMLQIFSNDLTKDDNGYRMTDNRDNTLKRYMGEKWSLYTSYIKPYAGLFKNMQERYGIEL